jgi:hypothetical protein
VTLMTGYGLEGIEFDSRHGQKCPSLLYGVFTVVIVAVSPGVKRPWLEANTDLNSIPCLRLHGVITSLPHTSSWRGVSEAKGHLYFFTQIWGTNLRFCQDFACVCPNIQSLKIQGGPKFRVGFVR